MLPLFRQDDIATCCEFSRSLPFAAFTIEYCHILVNATTVAITNNECMLMRDVFRYFITHAAATSAFSCRHAAAFFRYADFHFLHAFRHIMPYFHTLSCLRRCHYATPLSALIAFHCHYFIEILLFAMMLSLPCLIALCCLRRSLRHATFAALRAMLALFSLCYVYTRRDITTPYYC